VRVLVAETDFAVDENQRAAISRHELGCQQVAGRRDVGLAFRADPAGVQSMGRQQSGDEFAFRNSVVKRRGQQRLHGRHSPRMRFRAASLLYFHRYLAPGF